MKKFFAAALILLFAVCAFAAGKKNIIFVVADGGGPAVTGFLMQYAKYAGSSPYADKTSNLEKLFAGGKTGIVLNSPKDFLVTDSAAAGTHLAKGTLTYPEYLGLSADGENADSLLKKAKKAGMAAGLVTDAFLSDATPSAYTAAVESRKDYDLITPALLSGGVDVLLGGGLNYFVSKQDLNNPVYSAIFKRIPFAGELTPKSTDAVFEKLLTSGYPLAFDKTSLQSARGSKLLGLFGAEDIQYTISPAPYAPDLLDMTQKAVNILSKNENGFFLMVEAGALDSVLHENDQGAALAELLELDKVLGYLKDFADKTPDTLIIVTADHDTGGFGFSYRKLSDEELAQKQAEGYKTFGGKDYISTEVLDIIAKQTKRQKEMKKEFLSRPQEEQTPQAVQAYLKENMAYELPLEVIETAGGFEKSLKEVNKRLGVVWSTKTHTASPIFVTFYGASVSVPNIMHNTQINKIAEDFLYDGK